MSRRICKPWHWRSWWRWWGASFRNGHAEYAQRWCRLFAREKGNNARCWFSQLPSTAKIRSHQQTMLICCTADGTTGETSRKTASRPFNHHDAAAAADSPSVSFIKLREGFLIHLRPERIKRNSKLLHSSNASMRRCGQQKVTASSQKQQSKDTVKATNFGPHRNFASFFFASSAASLDESFTKYEQKQVCRSNVFLQHLFSSFFCRMRFNDSKPF